MNAGTRLTRRRFAAVAGSAPLPQVSEPVRKPRATAAGVSPISDEERRARIEKARRLMAENRIAAILLEPGPSLFYFTGVRWGLSERVFGFILPARGEAAYVAPAFEESRAREVIRFTTDIRIWHEDESPFKKVAEVLRDRGIRTGRVGIEEKVRFFLFDGLRKETPAIEYLSAYPVTVGCRVIKSPAEIALIERAADLAIEAFRAAFATLRAGMTQQELSANCAAAFRALGVQGGGLVALGQSSASPHGSSQPQNLKLGDIVLMDGGCSVEGYQSDLTRSIVFGKPTARQRQVWGLVRRAQDAALAAARPGATCESVDAAARKVITDAGFGPDYRLPGLPHRTGHGIGLEGHEWTNLVRGNKTRLQAGMCFSDEPMIAIPGEFGIRLEDCFYMTPDGPRLFSRQSPSIEQPFA